MYRDFFRKRRQKASVTANELSLQKPEKRKATGQKVDIPLVDTKPKVKRTPASCLLGEDLLRKKMARVIHPLVSNIVKMTGF